ncbi:MAG: T9SS type A sorting domain-containing protein, partial [Lentimicrobium sp.]|nr:T9SS type A sorting domain-containing protein [Lentimicrobium sp.]
MKTTLLKQLTVLALSLFTLGTAAQEAGKYSKNRLTHQMTPEEALRRHEIGRSFVETDPPTGTITSLGEFERAKGVLVAYPFGIPMTVIREMARDAIVTTLVTGASQESNVRSQYTQAGVNLDNCNFIYAQTDSYWTRDYGPWYIAYGDAQIGIVDFPYNRPRPNDDEAPKIVANALGIPWFGMNVIHTGGNYMSNSYGDAASTTIAYTENPGQSQSQIDQKMEDYLGITDYHVLEDPNNTYIDHIDCWGKFLATNKVLIRSVPASHPQYDELEATAGYFESLTSPWETPYEVYRVNTPQDQPYTNSFIFNDKVFVPIMGSQYDQAALDVYRQAMPGYKIIGIIGLPGAPWESTDALHCRTHEMADPEMLRIKHIPLLGNAEVSDNYTFTANITAFSGEEVIADSVLFCYRINPNPYTPFTTAAMTNSAGNEWTVTLPSPEYGSTVQYYIHAADASGKSENHPFIGRFDPHEFYIGAQQFAQAETDLQQMDFTAMQGFADTRKLNISNTGDLGLNFYLGLSTEALDTITKSVVNSPAASSYDFNTYTESGWTNITVDEEGTTGLIIVTYSWTTDNYASEGSLWAESPSGTKVMLASGQMNGTYTLSDPSFAGEALHGNWKLWIEDSYGDGGHQAKNVVVKLQRSTATGNWLSTDITEGSITPGNQQEILVSCDAAGLELGTYHGLISILSNDPDQPEIEIPVIFTVTINTGIESSAKENTFISVYPNPATDLLNLKINSAKPDIADITISDVSGKAIYSSGKNPLSKGINILTIPVSELTKGLYFLRVNSSTFE